MGNDELIKLLREQIEFQRKEIEALNKTITELLEILKTELQLELSAIEK